MVKSHLKDCGLSAVEFACVNEVRGGRGGADGMHFQVFKTMNNDGRLSNCLESVPRKGKSGRDKCNIVHNRLVK